MPVHEEAGAGPLLVAFPADGAVTISPAQLGYLLSGIDWRHPQATASDLGWLRIRLAGDGGCDSIGS